MDPATKDELEVLKELRERIQDLGLGKEDLTDRNLIRFLRARNGDLDATELMIRNNEKWQEAEDVKALLTEYEGPKGWDDDFYYALTGFDREGNPMILAPFGKWDMQKVMAEGNKEEFVRHIYHQMERCWNFLQKISKGGDHMKQAVGIVDLGGLSLRQCTSIDVVEASIRCLKTFEANYPETFKAAVVVNAPWAFQLIWKLIKPFLSERTHAKLFFIGNDKDKWREAITRFADLDQFPEYYGGELPNTTKIHISRDGTINKTLLNQNECEEDNRKQISVG